MNWLVILVAAIFIIGAVQGYRKGIIRITVSLVSMIVSLVACMFVTPAVCGFIRANTDAYTNMSSAIYEMMIKSDMYNEAYDDALGEEAGAANTSAFTTAVTEYEEQIKGYISEITDEMNLPALGMDDYKLSSMTDSIGNVLDGQATGIKNIIAAALAVRMADMAVNAIVYMGVFLIVFAIMKLVLVASGAIAALPLIRQANKAVGLVFGILEALVVVWLLLAVITACSHYTWASGLLTQIGSNPVMSFLYEHNMITKTIMDGMSH